MTSSPVLPWKRAASHRQAPALPEEHEWHRNSPRSPYCFYNRVWSTADCDDVFDYEGLSLASDALTTKLQSTRSISTDSAYEDPAYWSRDSEGGMSVEGEPCCGDSQDTHTDTATDSSSTERRKQHSRLARIFIRFAEKTSMQGVPYIYQATTLAGKFFWSLLFIVSLVFLAGHLYYLFDVFYSYPSHSTVELGFSPLHFPAVTFCNVNPVKKSKLQDMSAELNDLVHKTEPEVMSKLLAEQTAQYDKPMNRKRRQAQRGRSDLKENPNKGSGNNNAGGSKLASILRQGRPPHFVPGKGVGRGNGGGSTRPTTASPDSDQLEKPVDPLQELIEGLEGGVLGKGGGRRTRAITTTPVVITTKGNTTASFSDESLPQLDRSPSISDLDAAIDSNSAAGAPAKKTTTTTQALDFPQINPGLDKPGPAKKTTPQTYPDLDKPGAAQTTTPRTLEIPQNDKPVDKPVNKPIDKDTGSNKSKDQAEQAKAEKDKQNQRGGRKHSVDVINDLELGVKFTHSNKLKKLKKEELKALTRDQGEPFTEPSVTASIQSEFMFLYSNETRAERMVAGHQVEDMLLDCSFSGRRCHPQNFSLMTSTIFGNCFTIDYPDMVTARSGYQGGLSLIVFLEGEEYLKGLTTSTGIQVIIHPHATLPFPQEDGLAVMAGTETNIALRLIHINRLGPPHGSCQEGEVFFDKYNHTYSRRACQYYCEQETIMDRCKCYSEQTGEDLHRKTKRVLDPCHTERQLRCMLRVQAEFETGVVACDCDNPCTETAYSKTVSMRQWPSEEYVKVLVETLCTQRSAEECEKYRNTDPKVFTQSFVKINIFYEDLNYENITEVEDYELSQFVSDVGGTVGLWLGLSILSGFEVLQFFLEIAVYFLTFGCCRPASPKASKRKNTRLQRRAALRMSESTATGSRFSGY